MAGTSALENVRVVDLCDEKATYCGKLLADLGADVVLVEPPGGSSMRSIGPFHPGCSPAQKDDASLFFQHYNHNKRSVVIDLDSPIGRRELLNLTAEADVVIETFPPGHLATRELGYGAISKINPGLIHASITPFGQTGPYRDFRICDLVAQALGGLIYVNGEPDGDPLQGLGLPAYHSAGIDAATAVVLALLDRERSGCGRSIDVSIHASAAAILEHATSLFREDGTIARRNGGTHWTRAFHISACREGFITQSTFGDWTTLAEWVLNDQPDSVLADPRWHDRGYRLEHADRLFDALDAWAAARAAPELAEEAQLRRLPFASLGNVGSLLCDPHLVARNYFVPLRHQPTSTILLHAGPPYVFSRTPARIDRATRSDKKSSRVSQPYAHAARCTDSPAAAPLAGVRIVDFTWAVAGPLATRILADYGAEVVKIERPNLASDPARRRVLAAGLNRGKQSVAIDMTSRRGVAIAGALIARSDVVVDNFSPRVLPNWGLDHDHLRRLQPRIISIGISGFGSTGPYRDRVSYGPTLQAIAGHSLMMRSPQGVPTGWGFSYSDMIAGRTAAFAILVALRHRQQTGNGQRIDFSQLESLISVTGPLLLAMQTSAGAPPPGNASQEAAASPHGVYRCADRAEDAPAQDRWCAIAVFGDEDWQRFCRAIGAPLWTRDERFGSHAGRLLHRASLDAAVTAWTSLRTAEEAMRHLQRHGIAAGVVANAKDLGIRDVQLRHRGYWMPTLLQGGETVDLDGSPFDAGFGGRSTSPRPTPSVGQQTDAVLSSVLHLTSEQIAELKRDGVVA